MRNYIILNGVNSNTITGLLISTLPPITKPKIRTQTEEIDGRDGDIVTKLGYSAYDKEFEIGLYGDFDINEVISYFNSEGTVVFSNEEDKYYNYQILDQIDYEKLIRFKTATIRMHVQPFKYPLEEEQIQVDATVVEAEGSNILLQYTNPNHTITSELKGDLYQETTTGKNLFNNAMQPTNEGDSRVAVSTIDTGKRLDYTGSVSSGSYIWRCFAIMDLTNYVGRSIRFKCNFNASGNNKAQCNIGLCNADGTNRVTKAASTTSGQTISFVVPTLVGEQTYLLLTLYANANGSIQTNDYVEYTNMIFTIDNTDMTYEEYTGGQPSPNPDYPQEIEVVTGQQEILIETKNLFDKDSVDWYRNNSGQFDNKTNNSTTRIRSTSFSIKGGKTYTLSGLPSGINLLAIRTYNVPSGDSIGDPTLSGNTFTLDNNVNYIHLLLGGTGFTDDTITLMENANIQIEKGTEATDYVVYNSQSYTIDLGTTELYGIPDTTYRDRVYQDNNTWYIERQIGKVVLNGSENWVKGGTTNNNQFIITNPVNNVNISTLGQYNNNVVSSIFSNYFTPVGNMASNNGSIGISFCNFSPDTQIRLGYGISSNINTVELLKTWLSTHNTTVYYVLATPTAETITDTDLIAQLNELQEATTYENTTNISVTGNLPVILKATTSGMPNTVINNIGNIYAKPLITIYGSGTIGVYLNQIQVLQIDLGNNESITIDVSKMEAYNNSTKALMNRLVTGDYMKFLINSGENNIAFSGNVAGFTMDNYTRWL